MPSKVRILDPPHQQERPLTSIYTVRGRSSSGPAVYGPVRPSTGGSALYGPKFAHWPRLEFAGGGELFGLLLDGVLVDEDDAVDWPDGLGDLQDVAVFVATDVDDGGAGG